MGNRLPNGNKKNAIIPSTLSADIIECSDINKQLILKAPHRNTISERSDGILRSQNIDNNIPTTLDHSLSSSQKGAFLSSSSKSNSSRRSSSRTRLNLSTRTPALSFKQHPSSRMISIDSSDEIINQQSYSRAGSLVPSLSLDATKGDLLSMQRCPLDLETELDHPYDEMSHRTSIRMEYESSTARSLRRSASQNASRISLSTPIHSTSNTARRDNITGIITIPASSLSVAHINKSDDNLLSMLVSEIDSAAITPRQAFGINNVSSDSFKRPTALPSHLFAINDISDHDVDGILKQLDEEGDYYVGGSLQ